MQDNHINLNNLIQSEVDRTSQKYNKDFLDCDDLIKITGLGRDNVRVYFAVKIFQQQKLVKDKLSVC